MPVLTDRRKYKIVKRIVSYSEIFEKQELEVLNVKELIKLQKALLIPLIIKQKYKSRIKYNNDCL